MEHKSMRKRHKTAKRQRNHARIIQAAINRPCIDADYSEYLANLLSPGHSNCKAYLDEDTPFPMPTVCLSNGVTYNTAAAIDGGVKQGLQQIGTREYLCCFLTPGITTTSFGENIPSGFQIVQASTLQTPLTLTAGGAIDGMKSTIDFYGTDVSDIASNGACFAAQVTLRALAPIANVIGSYFRGSITIGQLFPAEGTSASNPTVQDLIQISDEFECDNGEITMTNHIINPNILSATHDTGTTSATYFNQMHTEIVEYVIIPRMAANVLQNNSGGNSLPNLTRFSLAGIVKSNWVFFPRLTVASDSLKTIAERTPEGKKIREAFEKAGNMAEGGTEILRHVGPIAHQHLSPNRLTSHGESHSMIRSLGHKIKSVFKHVSLGDVVKLAAAVRTGMKLLPVAAKVGALMEIHDSESIVVDLSALSFHLKIMPTIPLVGDPSFDDIVRDLRSKIKELKDRLSVTPHSYMYPPLEYDSPRDSIDPGKVGATLVLLGSHHTPEVVFMDGSWKLLSTEPRDKDWFNTFLDLFYDDASPITAGVSTSSKFHRF